MSLYGHRHGPTSARGGPTPQVVDHPGPRRSRWHRVGVAGIALLMVSAVACGSGDGPDAATTDVARSGVLAGHCPDPVVIQTDWEPEAEHGPIYQLVGPGYRVNDGTKSIEGPLVSNGEDTGVDIEVRTGGVAVAYAVIPSLMYLDTSITLGMVRLAEAIATSEAAPVLGVMAMFERSPIAFYWDPATYPDAQSVADLRDDDVTLLLGRPDVFVDWMVSEGIANESQLDLTETPKPATFVAAGGRLAELGFVTAEPYIYEFEVPEWGRPLRSELLDDLGFREYFQALAVRTDAVDTLDACLKRLVPIIQQATADYFADPQPTNELIVELVERYNVGWVYTLPTAEYSAATQRSLGLVDDGPNGTVGDFDLNRVQELIDITAAVTNPEVGDLRADDVVTNRFIDADIGL